MIYTVAEQIQKRYFQYIIRKILVGQKVNDQTEDKRYYRYLKNENGEYVGEIAYHFDPGLGGFVANVIVHARYRGRGYGGRALDMLCAAAKENGVTVLYDDIAAGNPAIALFLKHGFSVDSRTGEKIILKKYL